MLSFVNNFLILRQNNEEKLLSITSHCEIIMAIEKDEKKAAIGQFGR